MQRYRTIMMSVGDGVIATDTDGKVEMMNPVAEELTGWKMEEAHGKSLEEIFHIINEETRQIIENPVRRVMREGIVIGLANHSVLIAKDGTEHPIADSGSPIRYEKGEITGVVLVFRDQTQERKAQKALQESERKFRETIKYLDEGYYSCMMDGVLLNHNQAFNRILGFDIDQDLKGSKLPDFWQNPDDRKLYLKELMTRGFIRDYLINAKKINGEKIVVMVNSHLVKDEQGKPVRIEGTYTDFTDRKLAEEQLRKLNRIYSFLSDINQAIVRSRVPEELYDKVCKIAVEQGGFGMAWIGLIDESTQKIRVIAQAGRTNGYHEQVNISLKGKPLSYCPVDSTLRHGEHNICKILENIEIAPCQKIAYELGFRSSASFPLKVSDILKGVLTFYSDEPDFFDEAELKLLDELALDISFAMEYAEKETGRKRAEEALKASEKRVRITAGSLIDVVYEWDLKEKIEWFGDIDRIMGYPDNGFPRTLSGWAAKLHPEDKEKVNATIEGHLKRSEPYISEYRVMNKQGEWRWWTARGTALRDEQNIPYWWIGSITDITERKQAEETLQESESRYKTLVENIPQKIFMKSSEYRWMSVNENFARDLGISPEGIVGKLDHDLFSKELADKYHADDVRIITTGKTEELEEKYVVGGKETWVNTIKTPVRDKNGEIVGLLGIFWDITGRKQAEETLRIKNQVFEDSIASQSIADSTGMITHVNKAFLHLWGYTSKEQAIGNSVGSFFADQADSVPVLEALAAHDAWEGEFRAKRTDGSTFISRGFATTLRNTQGELIGYQSTNLDVTKEREADEEIRKLNAELEDRVILRTAQLEATNKELESFSYSVSHDLRAPLRHVSGYVELLNKRFQSDLPEKGRHYLDSISDSVHVMGNLIDDLLQFSRSGRMELHQSDCNMNEIVKEVIESLHKDNPDRKIEWVQGKLPYVNGDEAMLRLVWSNLLSNAVKFTRTRRKARIEIGVRKENKELIFFVRDNGVGFDMQYAQKLFGVFQRLHSTEEFEGTGIGLANVQRIVLRHGGRTWAEAEPDKGAVFYFSIPNK